DRAADGDPHALVRFQALIAVPLGDRRARRELERAHPDPEVVAEGLVAGRNHPDDVDAMAMVFRRLRRTPHVAAPIELWRAAHRELVRLTAVADRLRDVLGSPNAPDARVRIRLRRKIASIDAHVTPLEDGFSATLGQGARLLARVLLVLVVGAALTLV